MKKFLLAILGFFTVALSAVTDIPGIAYHQRVDRDWSRPLELAKDVKNFQSCTYYPAKRKISCVYTSDYARKKGKGKGYIKERHVLTSQVKPSGNVKIYGTFKDEQLIPTGETKEVTYYVYRVQVKAK